MPQICVLCFLIISVIISVFAQFYHCFVLVFVNEVDNDPATQAIEIVINYIKKNPSLGISVNLLPVEGNRTDSKKFLENSKCYNSHQICTAFDCCANKVNFTDNIINCNGTLSKFCAYLQLFNTKKVWVL